MSQNHRKCLFVWQKYEKSDNANNTFTGNYSFFATTNARNNNNEHLCFHNRQLPTDFDASSVRNSEENASFALY